MRFVLGLAIFIGVSFGATIAASKYDAAQGAERATAAAEAAMLQSR